METVTLNNGVAMPVVGLGTHTLKGLKMIRGVRCAYKLGYRNFDTAWLYRNESSLKWGLRLAGIKRRDVFITSKLEWKQIVAGVSIKASFEGTLKRLGTDYIDLYLVHWPKPEMYLDMWEHICDFYKQGRIRAVGVSSFLEDHFEKLKLVSDIVPAVNQIELHPLNNRRELVKYCQNHGIQVEAHSPFARGAATLELMQHPFLIEIAVRHGRSVAQVILRWIVQQGFVTIPRSIHEYKLKENINVFDFSLSKDEMEMIDSLNQDKYFGGDPRRTLPFI